MRKTKKIIPFIMKRSNPFDHCVDLFVFCPNQNSIHIRFIFPFSHKSLLPTTQHTNLIHSIPLVFIIIIAFLRLPFKLFINQFDISKRAKKLKSIIINKFFFITTYWILGDIQRDGWWLANGAIQIWKLNKNGEKQIMGKFYPKKGKAIKHSVLFQNRNIWYGSDASVRFFVFILLYPEQQ